MNGLGPAKIHLDNIYPDVERHSVTVLVDEELRRPERPERRANDTAHRARVADEGGQGVVCHDSPEWMVAIIGVGIGERRAVVADVRRVKPHLGEGADL